MGRIRTIIVVPYDPAWAETYRREAEQLRLVFGSLLIDIHHIGSTSIPGLSAKPIIDMMPIVRDIEKVDSYNEYMREIGYEPRGENGIVGRRYFVKGGDIDRTHHVHIYAADSPEVAKHLDFRDYVNAHPDALRDYAELKIELARQFPHDIESYMAGKDAFIKETIEKARVWRRA
jgi:GrpB-like predicted nucleotidyltransferase (UPF0157 family)